MAFLPTSWLSVLSPYSDSTSSCHVGQGSTDLAGSLVVVKAVVALLHSSRLGLDFHVVLHSDGPVRLGLDRKVARLRELARLGVWA